MKELTINVGPMFSGKTTALQQQGMKHLKANQKAVFLKPVFDNRFSDDHIVSHDGVKVPAINIDETLLVEEVLSADVVLIDEVQFLNKNIVKELWELIRLEKRVYCSGLDMDFKGKGFATTMEIMAMAGKVNKFVGICTTCKGEATMSSKKSSSNKRLQLGSADLYYPTCKACYIEEGKGEVC